MPTSTLSGHGRDEVYEVSDGMRVRINSSSPGKPALYFMTCFGWYAWKCEAASFLKWDVKYKWDQLPGWYPAEEKWWKEGDYLPLPPRDLVGTEHI
jgi:hypothetical protein